MLLIYQSTILLRILITLDSTGDIDMPSEVDGDQWNLELLYDALGKLFMFINAYLLQATTNEVAIYGSFAHESVFLGPNPDDLVHLNYASFSKKVMNRIIELYANEEFQKKMSESKTQDTSKIGSALKKSNWYINNWKLRSSRTELSTVADINNMSSLMNHSARILIFQVSKDNNDDYNSMVNCIFACQKNNVVIDSIIYNQKDSILLQQWAYLTNGTSRNNI